MIEHVNLIDRLSIERQRQLLKDAEEFRLLKQIEHQPMRVSHRVLGNLGTALESWGSHLKRKYTVLPEKTRVS